MVRELRWQMSAHYCRLAFRLLQDKLSRDKQIKFPKFKSYTYIYICLQRYLTHLKYGLLV